MLRLRMSRQGKDTDSIGISTGTGKRGLWQWTEEAERRTGSYPIELFGEGISWFRAQQNYV